MFLVCLPHCKIWRHSSDRNRVCRRFRVFCLLSVKVCSWYKTHSKTENLAGVWYVSILSVPGIQFRPVTVSFEAFSGHKTMTYTLKVLNNLIRDRGSDCNCIINGRLELLVELCQSASFMLCCFATIFFCGNDHKQEFMFRTYEQISDSNKGPVDF